MIWKGGSLKRLLMGTVIGEKQVEKHQLEGRN